MSLSKIPVQRKLRAQEKTILCHTILKKETQLLVWVVVLVVSIECPPFDANF